MSRGGPTSPLSWETVARPGGYCAPRRPTHFEPSSLEFTEASLPHYSGVTVTV